MKKYFDYSILFISNGNFTIPFKPVVGKKYTPAWKSNNDILIKRDFDNNIWFGLNKEKDLMKSCKYVGKVRIVMGFMNRNQPDEIFKLVELKKLRKDSKE